MLKLNRAAQTICLRLAVLAAVCCAETVLWASSVPVSTAPPGGLAPSNTPQIVLLTFDDAVTLNSYDLVQQVLTNHCNPNGDTIKATFFVALNAGYDYYSIRRLYDAGHEIALHTISHSTDHTCSIERWRQEIAGEKRILVNLSGIPAEDINGFRAPRVDPNDNTFRVLHERGFRYDASMREALGMYSTAPDNLIWPYTLDNGLQQIAAPPNVPLTNYPGLFEIPVWVQFTNSVALALTDPPSSLNSNQVVSLWKENFLSRYNGNRSPYGIFLHAVWDTQWLSNPQHKAWRIGALNEFITWALQHPDTWFITCNDLVDYMLNPAEAAEAASHQSFKTPVRTPFPENEIVECYFPGKHVFYTCGVDTPFAPDYQTAYLGSAWLPGEAITANVVSQNTEFAWCRMTVSNNTPHQVSDWTVDFTIAGGNLLSLYDATWSQTDNHLSAAARHYNRTIPTGGWHEIDFRISRTGGTVSFNDVSLKLLGVGPQHIKVVIKSDMNSELLHLSWDDNAYAYSIETSTNLNDATGWQVVSDNLIYPAVTLPLNNTDTPRFYRVKGELYLDQD